MPMQSTPTYASTLLRALAEATAHDERVLERRKEVTSSGKGEDRSSRDSFGYVYASFFNTRGLSWWRSTAKTQVGYKRP